MPPRADEVGADEQKRMNPIYAYGLFTDADRLIGVVITEKGAKARIGYEIEYGRIVKYYKPIKIIGQLGRCIHDNHEADDKIPGGELLLHATFETTCSCVGWDHKTGNKDPEKTTCCAECHSYIPIQYYIYPITWVSDDEA